jgi:hypothetical protein
MSPRGGTVSNQNNLSICERRIKAVKRIRSKLPLFESMSQIYIDGICEEQLLFNPV